MEEPHQKNPIRAASDASAEKTTLSLTAIQEAISSIRFGVVQIIIQDGKVIQIDKTEKIRLV